MMTRFVVEKLTLVLAVQIGEWLNICKKNCNFDLNNTIPDFSPLIHLLMLHIFHKFQLSLPGTIYCSPLTLFSPHGENTHILKCINLLSKKTLIFQQ